MLAKLLCWLLGHKFMVKAFTGMTYRCLHAFRGEEDISLYVWRAQKYCIRCGKPNKNVIGGEKVDIKNISVKNTINYKWPSLEKWMTQYLAGNGDNRGYAYPIVGNAWRSAREVED